MEVVITSDVAVTASELLEERLAAALEDQQRASIALSGGSTPWPVFDRLAAANLDWARIDIFQVDERVAPEHHPDRNLSLLTRDFMSRVPAVLHPMPVNETDLEVAARNYEAVLPERFDVVHLGLGSDGHTASLVPGDAALDVDDRDVAVSAMYQGRRRMTLTYRAIDRAASVVWVVTGESKSAMIGRLVAGDPGIPAGRVSADRAIVVTDVQPDG